MANNNVIRETAWKHLYSHSISYFQSKKMPLSSAVLALSLCQYLVVALIWVSSSTLVYSAEAPGKISTNVDQTWELAGLKQATKILIDRWGVPHIYAANQDDLFFTQGFNAARDRLFQIDLWRRRGLGQLSAVFGSAFIEQDKATRLFLYKGDMQTEWRAYGQDAARITNSFVAGINAYVDYVIKNPEALPFEFKAMAYLPAKWQTEDVVRIRSHGLTRNLTSEVARAQAACSGDLSADEIRVGLQPAWKTKVPQGLDPCLPANLLQVFQLATQNVVFDPNKMKTAQSAIAIDPAIALTMEYAPAQESMEGSNNWVIAPAKSSTGRAIMANDPHRAYSTPSLRYLAHLSAPGLDVIGAGEPALPGISIGHNGSIAFGLTIFSIDQEDLYVYETNPANSMQYNYQGKWLNFSVQKEVIAVKGGMSINVELLFSRHGPIIFREHEKNRAFAVRSGWLEAGMAPYFGSIDYMRAKNFSEFKRSMLHWGAPTENQVYADTKGNIGWVAGGLTPIRPNWDGLLPVPGDGRYEWAGFLSGDKLPFSYNPTSGWIASANEFNLPAGYPYQQHKLGFEWPHNSRATRIAEVLTQLSKVSIQDSMHLQNDVLSIPARRLVALIQTLNSSDEKTQAALNVLKSWDSIEHADSGAAALFEVWWSRYLGPAFKLTIGGKHDAQNLAAPDPGVMLNSLENIDARFGADARSRRDQLLFNSLRDAYLNMEKLQGKDSKSWRWGSLQTSFFSHPLASLSDPATRTKINVGPFPRSGSAYTVNQSSYRPQDFLHINGPSFRIVVDVGNWDNSQAMNTPGQAGDPDNQHYRDLVEKWAKGDYFPLLYSRGAVESATTQKLELLPLKILSSQTMKK